MQSPDAEGPDASTRANLGEPAAFGCDVLVVNDQAVVTVCGELDLATAPEVLEQVVGTLGPPVSAVTLDLGGVTFLDSSGLGALLAAGRRCADVGTTLRLESVPNHARRVIEITGVAELLGLEREAR
jgi:anti-sigma B factor antagonist